MKVVVSGAAGFIGSHLVESLAGQGHRVVAIDRRAEMPGVSAKALAADLCDPSFYATLLDEVSTAGAVFHLAGCPGVRDCGPEVALRRRRDNVAATRVVLAAVPPEIPLVATSSSSVYGGAEGGSRLRPSHEDDPPRPRGGYAASKLEMEALCRLRAAAGGLIAIARPFTVAGERQRPDMAIATWIQAAAAGQPIRIFGSPQRSRDITDVHDVVKALIRMAEMPVAGTVNVGTGVPRSLSEIVDAIATVLGRSVTATVEPAGPAEPSATLADTTRCAKLLGFTPAIDLVDLVDRQARAAMMTASEQSVAAAAVR